MFSEIFISVKINRHKYQILSLSKTRKILQISAYGQDKQTFKNYDYSCPDIHADKRSLGKLFRLPWKRKNRDLN